MQGSVTVELRSKTAWIRLNRPEAANAINEDMRQRLSQTLDTIEGDTSVRAIVITGNGRSFAAGSDVAELSDLSANQSVLLSERIAVFHQRLSQSQRPVIAAINGWCLGGGFELALACDIRIASEKARFGLPEPTLGIVSGGGGIPRLTRLTGPGVARHMSLTGEIIDASAALAHGIVTRVFPVEELEQEADKIAERISTLAPISVAQAKRILTASEDGNIADAVAYEAQACAACFATQDQKEGMQAFLEKRPPHFIGS